MDSIREDIVFAAYKRAYTLTDMNIQDTLDKKLEFRRKTILADKSLTKDEKSYAIKLLNKDFDYYKILGNEGTKRICENCHDECLATLYCEHCVRNYLKSNFSNWTSGNNDIDNLIQQCQMETLEPNRVIEWIPYNKLQNIKYLTKGGCSEIYGAYWIDGRYDEWDSKEKKLKRTNGHDVILKKLENVESANRSWFDESKFHLCISNKHSHIVQCYGLTKKTLDGNYMLVLFKLNNNLKEYLQQNYNKLTWEKRIQIIGDIVYAVSNIHSENAIHRDLHSGNILLFKTDIRISDLGFCGPADKPLNSIYGNLPYIAPEVISGKGTSFASDIYSIGMLMWEISSGQPPFVCKHNYDLAIKIINGMRPKIIPGTPLEYKKLMVQCWDADPTKRPDINTLYDKIRKMNRLNYLNENNELTNTITDTNNFQIISDYSISSSSINTFNFSSRIYEFKDLPEPRNATKEEQEAYHSVQLDYDLREDNLMIIIVTNIQFNYKYLDNKANNESKRIYLNEDEKDISITDNSKKKLKTSKNDEIYNPKLHSDENSFDKTLGTNFCNNHSLDKMDLNYMLN
ncbi:hypothetical protein RclHR1_01130009 [Rhizophagus clarus]|uniref:Protein kinase domain-containing protein n=1 Tax=Rhizophagus clarus TaxID=94130 RepID=A0A2Z6QIS7_9GLOM|nr:hypothetical protein RclHR1_01130009 [Rhizophagus clarus]